MQPATSSSDDDLMAPRTAETRPCSISDALAAPLLCSCVFWWWKIRGKMLSRPCMDRDHRSGDYYRWRRLSILHRVSEISWWFRRSIDHSVAEAPARALGINKLMSFHNYFYYSNLCRLSNHCNRLITRPRNNGWPCHVHSRFVVDQLQPPVICFPCLPTCVTGFSPSSSVCDARHYSSIGRAQNFQSINHSSTGKAPIPKYLPAATAWLYSFVAWVIQFCVPDQVPLNNSTGNTRHGGRGGAAQALVQPRIELHV